MIFLINYRSTVSVQTFRTKHNRLVLAFVETGQKLVGKGPDTVRYVNMAGIKLGRKKIFAVLEV